MNYIYKIWNDINNKVYIGKTSRNLEIRFSEHLWASQRTYKNRPLYDAMNKYGQEHFFIEKVEECKTNEELSELEIKWIAYYDSYNNGYNATIGGDGLQSMLNKKDVIDKYLKLKSYYKVAKEFNVDESRIRKLIGKDPTIPCFHKKPKVREIVMIKDGKILRKFKSINEAKTFLGKSKNDGHISQALHKKQKTAFNYEWKYFNELSTDEISSLELVS